MTHNQHLERGRKKLNRGNDSCHLSDLYFLPCFVYLTIMFQNKNGMFQHKNQTIN